MPSLPTTKDDACDFYSHQCEIENSAYSPLFNSPLDKETAAGEGVTLFGLLMTSDLAVFQNIIRSFIK